jgi:NADH dehydrogenase [ubiquinone] 1 alpha subcomplex assembly factor 2
MHSIGVDLEGNTFWEMKDAARQANRFRRMVQYADRNVHHSEVKVPPQWMQWLRHTRQTAPTIAEQERDIVRQSQMRQLAEAADARWAAQPSYLVAPDDRETHSHKHKHQLVEDGTQLDEAARMMGISNQPATTAPDTIVESRPVEAPPSSQSAQTSRDASTNAQPNPWDTTPKPKDEPDAWKPKIAKR